MGLMLTGWRPDEVDKTGRFIWELPPPRGLMLMLKDRNLLGNAIDLASLDRSAAVRTARFGFVEITLRMNVLMTLQYLLRGVSTLCSSLVGIRALVVRLPQYTSGSERFGFGCHMRGLPMRVDVLPGDQDAQHFSLRGERLPIIWQRVN